MCPDEKPFLNHMFKIRMKNYFYYNNTSIEFNIKINQTITIFKIRMKNYFYHNNTSIEFNLKINQTITL